MTSVLAYSVSAVNVAWAQEQATPAAEAFRAWQTADPSE